uniref:Uncharacterized protein n=1 Tax=Octopus bimaculoides TaxID=37653 RepID=A0A0L8HYF0_OCTBM
MLYYLTHIFPTFIYILIYIYTIHTSPETELKLYFVCTELDFSNLIHHAVHKIKVSRSNLRSICKQKQKKRSCIGF